MRTEGDWTATPTSESGWDFWNGNLVGGSSNLMSGFFHRLKPVDFRQLAELGPIEGANRADWPIGSADLEPYYGQVERLVDISGPITEHPNLEPRSSADFSYPPTLELEVPPCLLSRPNPALRKRARSFAWVWRPTIT